MKLRAALGLTLLFAFACKPSPGSARITVVFENETQTQCIKATAKTASGATIAATPAAIRREGDTLLIGIAENSDLTGTIFVTITRYATADCTGPSLGSETRSTSLVPGGPPSMLEFRFVGESTPDGGSDAGVEDAGVDAGVDAGPACDTASCGNAPSECETTTARGCAADGGCLFTSRGAGTPCDGGVCNAAGACASDVCAVLNAGESCDDGLPCTPSSTCQADRVCRGGCAMPPPCQRTVTPVSCSATTPTSCEVTPDVDGTNCTQVAGGVCLQGACRPWLNLPNAPTNLRVNATTAPYPTTAWALASPDGGACDTVISTSGAMPTVTASGCGSPSITATIDDAGVAVMTMTGLTVAPEARLHFTGARPVQLIVLGDAEVGGLLSVAPRPGQGPAGANPPSCSTVQDGTSSKAGGGGGGYGGVGGTGGESGGTGGAANATANIVLRGGCTGGIGAGNIGGGVGGGALQLIVNGALTLSGVVTASGGGGAAGTADGEGGGGGGSGGTVIVEAKTIELNGGAVTANGGGGGEGGDSGATSDPGAPGSFTTALPTNPADSAGSQAGVGGQGGANDQPGGTNGGSASSNRGGGGGGGGVGAVFVRAMPCTRGTGVISGRQLMAVTCN